jgi:hypothetical protein
MMTPLALMLWMNSAVSAALGRTFASMTIVFGSMCSMTPLVVVVFSMMLMGSLSPSTDFFACPARESIESGSAGVHEKSGEIRELATASDLLGTQARSELR